MNNYILYFDVFGKKMKVRIAAKNEEEARKKLISNLKLHSIVKEKTIVDDIFNLFK